MATYNAGGQSVMVVSPPDIHICGFCKQQFNNFELFVAHKQTGCSLHTTDTTALTESHTECVFEENFHICATRGVKKILTKAQKAPSKKLKPALTSKRHTCCFSGCTFKTQYGQKDMERHLKTHTGEKPFECELCHKRFSRRDKLNMHSRLHTGEKPHKCKHCPYAAADSSSLKKHLRIHYDERPFKCQICPYASRNSSQLTVHLRSHTGDAPFQCQHCDAKFKINSDLKRHVRIHSGEKPYKCDFCEYRCAMKGNLKSHTQIKHATDNSFQCLHCDFTCTNKTALRQHSREHQPTQPIQCSTCSYSCSSKGALKVHVRIHSEERPFKCDLCSFASKQRSNLAIHRKKCHSDTAEKCGDVAAHKPASARYRAKLEAARAFCCDSCDASFVREDSLRSHKKQHGDAEKTIQLQLSSTPDPVPVAPVSSSQPKLSPFSTAQLKIILSHSLEQQNTFPPAGEEVGGKSNVVLLSPENQDMVVNSMIQLNILAPMQSSQTPEPTLEPQALLLTQLGSQDPNTSLHAHTFITSCSALEGLNALIQEGGTEVTVVTKDGSALVATSPPADVNRCVRTVVETSSEENLLIDSVPPIMSTQTQQTH